MIRRFLILALCLVGMWSFPSIKAAPSVDFSAQVVYQSPQAAARFVQAETTLLIRFDQSVETTLFSADLVSVYGSRSGFHSGTLVLAADQRTLIFTPEMPFEYGERVDVVWRSHTSNRGTKVAAAWHFQVMPQPSNQRPSTSFGSLLSHSVASVKSAGGSAPYRTAPATFPQISVTSPATNTAEGFVLASNFIWGDRINTNAYLLMLDNQAEPMYYHALQPGVIATDFRVVSDTLLVHFNTATSLYYLYDQQYQLIDTYAAGNGYTMDLHEFLLLPNGHALFMIYDLQEIDMSQIVPGGDPNATVIGLVIQEMDRDHNVVFEWRSWDHIPITDGYVDFTTAEVDYIHGNSIEVDTDGHLLVSNRHTHDVIKIDRQTGAVRWRLGGRQNDFTFDPPSSQFYAQHDARRLPNGNLMLFNNWRSEPFSDTLNYSSIMEYELDETNFTATLVSEHRRSPDTSAWAMGSAQHFSNGNTSAGWGSSYAALYTEWTSSGEVALELDLSGNEVSYRAKRFAWQGQPLWPPRLYVEEGLGATHLFMSWNGATEVTSYTIALGSGLNGWTPIMTVARAGFETEVTLAKIPNEACLVRVEALGSAGTVLGISPRMQLPERTCAAYHQQLLPVISR